MNLNQLSNIASKIGNYSQQVYDQYSSNKTMNDKFSSIQKLKLPEYENYTEELTNIYKAYDELTTRIKECSDIFYPQHTCWYVCHTGDCCEQWQMYTASDGLKRLKNKLDTFRLLYF